MIDLMQRLNSLDTHNPGSLILEHSEELPVFLAPFHSAPSCIFSVTGSFFPLAYTVYVFTTSVFDNENVEYLSLSMTMKLLLI